MEYTEGGEPTGHVRVFLVEPTGTDSVPDMVEITEQFFVGPVVTGPAPGESPYNPGQYNTRVSTPHNVDLPLDGIMKDFFGDSKPELFIVGDGQSRLLLPTCP